MNDNKPCSNPYNNFLDNITSKIREELESKIQQVVGLNQELFVAQYIKQYPDVDFSKIILHHKFNDWTGCYTFWVEHTDECLE